MERCVRNIPAQQDYGGMCRNYSCTCEGYRYVGCIRTHQDYGGNILAYVSAMEGCVGNIPAHVYVSAMERCAKMFLHTRVVYMEELISKASVQGQCTFLYNANVQCALIT